MDELCWAVLGLAWLLMVIVLSKVINFPSIPKPKSPLGPRPWPIIGNLNLLGSNPHQSLHMLSKKYGDIMQLKLGSTPVIVASSPEMAKQFLKVHDRSLAYRPPTASGKFTAYDYSNLFWAPYGPHWHQVRKIYLNELFSAKSVESHKYIRVEERHAFISRLYELSGLPIKLREHLARYTLTTISRMVLKQKYFDECSKSESSVMQVKDYHEMLDEYFLLNGVFNIGDWIPWLSFLDLQGYVKRMKALQEKIDTIYDHMLDDRMARMGRDEDFKAKNIVDVLLQLTDDDSNLEIKFTRNWVKSSVQELMSAGTDSSAITLEWAISELMKQPKIISKAAEELDRVIGKERWVEEEDLPQLPYIDAIVKEAMRLHPLGMLAHFAIEDCNIAGYDIRKGTVAFINLWSIGRDTMTWDSPEEFFPERFLGKSINSEGNHFELLPFGSGRRMCPGYRLGQKILKSTLANLLHGFNWKLPDDMKPEDISMEELYGIIVKRKSPIVAIMEPRLPTHLYRSRTK